MVYWDNDIHTTTEQKPETSMTNKAAYESLRTLAFTLITMLAILVVAFIALVMKYNSLEETTRKCHTSAMANYWQVAALQYERAGDQQMQDNAGQEVARILNNAASRSIVHAFNDCDDQMLSVMQSSAGSK